MSKMNKKIIFSTFCLISIALTTCFVTSCASNNTNQTISNNINKTNKQTKTSTSNSNKQNAQTIALWLSDNLLPDLDLNNVSYDAQSALKQNSIQTIAFIKNNIQNQLEKLSQNGNINIDGVLYSVNTLMNNINIVLPNNISTSSWNNGSIDVVINYENTVLTNKNNNSFEVNGFNLPTKQAVTSQNQSILSTLINEISQTINITNTTLTAQAVLNNTNQTAVINLIKTGIINQLTKTNSSSNLVVNNISYEINNLINQQLNVILPDTISSANNALGQINAVELSFNNTVLNNNNTSISYLVKGFNVPNQNDVNVQNKAIAAWLSSKLSTEFALLKNNNLTSQAAIETTNQNSIKQLISQAILNELNNLGTICINNIIYSATNLVNDITIYLPSSVNDSSNNSGILNGITLAYNQNSLLNSTNNSVIDYTITNLSLPSTSQNTQQDTYIAQWLANNLPNTINVSLTSLTAQQALFTNNINTTIKAIADSINNLLSKINNIEINQIIYTTSELISNISVILPQAVSNNSNDIGELNDVVITYANLNIKQANTNGYTITGFLQANNANNNTQNQAIATWLSQNLSDVITVSKNAYNAQQATQPAFKKGIQSLVFEWLLKVLNNSSVTINKITYPILDIIKNVNVTLPSSVDVSLYNSGELNDVHLSYLSINLTQNNQTINYLIKGLQLPTTSEIKQQNNLIAQWLVKTISNNIALKNETICASQALVQQTTQNTFVLQAITQQLQTNVINVASIIYTVSYITSNITIMWPNSVTYANNNNGDLSNINLKYANITLSTTYGAVIDYLLTGFNTPSQTFLHTQNTAVAQWLYKQIPHTIALTSSVDFNAQQALLITTDQATLKQLLIQFITNKLNTLTSMCIDNVIYTTNDLISSISIQWPSSVSNTNYLNGQLDNVNLTYNSISISSNELYSISGLMKPNTTAVTSQDQAIANWFNNKIISPITISDSNISAQQAINSTNKTNTINLILQAINTQLKTYATTSIIISDVAYELSTLTSALVISLPSIDSSDLNNLGELDIKINYGTASVTYQNQTNFLVKGFQIIQPIPQPTPNKTANPTPQPAPNPLPNKTTNAIPVSNPVPTNPLPANPTQAELTRWGNVPLPYVDASQITTQDLINMFDYRAYHMISTQWTFGQRKITAVQMSNAFTLWIQTRWMYYPWVGFSSGAWGFEFDGLQTSYVPINNTNINDKTWYISAIVEGAYSPDLNTYPSLYKSTLQMLLNDLQNMIMPNMTNADKVMEISLLVMRWFDYSGNIFNGDPWRAIYLHQGVCSNYANLVTFLCNCVGVPALPMVTDSFAHEYAWVQITPPNCSTPKWCLCDPTFGSGYLGNGITYHPHYGLSYIPSYYTLEWILAPVGQSQFTNSSAIHNCGSEIFGIPWKAPFANNDVYLGANDALYNQTFFSTYQNYLMSMPCFYDDYYYYLVESNNNNPTVNLIRSKYFDVGNNQPVVMNAQDMHISSNIFSEMTNQATQYSTAYPQMYQVGNDFIFVLNNWDDDFSISDLANNVPKSFYIFNMSTQQGTIIPIPNSTDQTIQDFYVNNNKIYYEFSSPSEGQYLPNHKPYFGKQVSNYYPWLSLSYNFSSAINYSTSLATQVLRSLQIINNTYFVNNEVGGVSQSIKNQVDKEIVNITSQLLQNNNLSIADLQQIINNLNNQLNVLSVNAISYPSQLFFNGIMPKQNLISESALEQYGFNFILISAYDSIADLQTANAPILYNLLYCKTINGSYKVIQSGVNINNLGIQVESKNANVTYSGPNSYYLTNHPSGYYKVQAYLYEPNNQVNNVLTSLPMQLVISNNNYPSIGSLQNVNSDAYCVNLNNQNGNLQCGISLSGLTLNPTCEFYCVNANKKVSLINSSVVNMNNSTGTYDFSYNLSSTNETGMYFVVLKCNINNQNTYLVSNCFVYANSLTQYTSLQLDNMVQALKTFKLLR